MSSNELQQRIENSSSERDSTLQEAQEIADRLDSAEREKDQLQLALELAQNQIDELQFQLDELSKRWVVASKSTSSFVLVPMLVSFCTASDVKAGEKHGNEAGFVPDAAVVTCVVSVNTSLVLEHM